MKKKAKDFKVGIGRKDITPQLGSLLYGYPRERRAESVLDRLNVSAVAFEQDGQSVLLLSADLCVTRSDLCDRVRDAISQSTGIRREYILYSVIHTHSGPATSSSAGWGDADLEYVEGILLPRSVEAAVEALANMQPAVMGVGVVESQAGINRRQVTAEGKVILGQNPDGPYDPTMTVIAFQTMTGQCIGSIVQFAAHPTVAGSNFSVTRDWPGVMLDRMEEITGAKSIFINGAEGDVGPRLSNGETTGEEIHIEEIGRIAADDAERALRDIREFNVPVLNVETDVIFLPFAQAPLREEVEAEIKALGDPKKLVDVNVTRYAQLQKMKEVYDLAQEFPKGIELMQTVVTLGNLALVPLPFEAFSEISVLLKKESPYGHTLLLGLTNGYHGYLPTEAQIPYGGYEVDAFHATGILGFDDSLANLIVSENVKMLKKAISTRNN